MRRSLALSAAIMAFIIMLLPSSVLAASGSLSIQGASCGVGDAVNVDVTFSGKSIGGVDAEFTYDAELLQFVGGENASGADGSGRIALVANSSSLSSLKCSLAFKALQAGDASVSVSVKQMIAYDESSLGTPSGSAVVNILAPGEPSPSAFDSTASTIETMDIFIDSTRHKLCKKLPFGAPSGCTVSSVTHNGETVEVAVSGESVFAYVLDKNGQNGCYCKWDVESGAFERALSHTGSYLLLPLPSPAPDELSDCPKGKLLASGDSAECYETEEGFCVVYAICDGNEGYYIYDKAEGSLQRLHDRSADITYSQPSVEEPEAETAADAPEANDKKTDFLSIILYVLCGIAVILIAVLIALIISGNKGGRNRRRNDYV